ncbi:hypothetical protein BWI17_03580 [Betaproteobacteria bacterium GR16-43]|nr:hypothetical protein BWI17_03580 [Betaproteobacteria bacterium GR16-43]
MSRFTPTDENLRIEVADAAADAYSIAVARSLAKIGERKIYFMSFVPLQYPELKRFKGVAVTFLSSGQTPPDLLRSSRIVHSKGALSVASPKILRKDQWLKVVSEIEAEIAKGATAA